MENFFTKFKGATLNEQDTTVNYGDNKHPNIHALYRCSLCKRKNIMFYD